MTNLTPLGDIYPNDPALHELQDVADRNGGLLVPHAVVQAAADPDTALHSQFEWDDTVAGERYREDQARALIRRYVRFIKTGEDEPPKRVRAFVSVPGESEKDRAYMDTRKVARDPVLAERVTTELRRDLAVMRRRLVVWEEFEEVVTAIDKL